MKRLIVSALPLALLAGASLSCSLAAHTKGSRESGQSNLMADSFAGKNACNPENHLRPFIIEWDATDASSFEQHAANDIVFVEYEGCSLRVLDECRNETIRGEAGAYKPAEWTSGALETLDVNNSAELYAKLPLGQATLGGRVEGGEKFHMEYYVAGTRTATRDAVFQQDLEGKYGCEKATHFVYGYNLGAFGLASSKNLTASAGGSAFGFGAGGSETRASSAEKRGGKLAVCDSESAKEVEGCKAPIRLTLRPIRPGENPDKTAMSAQETPESLNAAGLVNAKVEMSEEARGHYDSAVTRMQAKDGKACLKSLDAHDKIDAKHKSSDPKGGLSYMRAQCLMLAGQCDAGKSLYRKSMEQSGQFMPERIDGVIDAYAGMHCQGKMSDRDTLLKALMELQKGAYQGDIGAKACTEAYKTVLKLRDKVKPKDEEDSQVASAKSAHQVAAPCLGRAGDCKAAYKVYSDGVINEPYMQNTKDPAVRDQIIKSGFESMVGKCKGKL
ncbi:MAG: hypothetical protein JNK45_01035 [Myxococcales bacterium]|nr:hypothetical protein [Myxococcales bacterium]